MLLQECPDILEFYRESFASYWLITESNIRKETSINFVVTQLNLVEMMVLHWVEKQVIVWMEKTAVQKEMAINWVVI